MPDTAPKQTGITEMATIDPVNPQAAGFVERVTPQTPEKLFLFKCPDPCGGIHFRHAGYVKLMLPFLKPNQDKHVAMESLQVNICVKCRKALVWVEQQMYDVSGQIDLNAWERAEKELHKATGPGGEC